MEVVRWAASKRISLAFFLGSLSRSIASGSIVEPVRSGSRFCSELLLRGAESKGTWVEVRKGRRDVALI
jgi:hypothetical protein